MDIKLSAPTCGSPAFVPRGRRPTAVQWSRMRQKSVAAARFFTPFCLMLLLGSPAISESASDAGTGSRERAVMIAQRPTPAPVGQQSPTGTERRPPVAQSPVALPSAPELLSALKRERARVQALLHDLAATRRELQAARRETQTERQLGATLTQELNAAWAALKDMSAQLDQAANTTVEAREAADAVVSEANEKAAHERARSAALEEKLLAARKDVDAIKNDAQAAGGAREETLRRELAAARQELDAMRRAGEDAALQARRVADTAADQKRALEEQRRTTEKLSRDLTTVRREMEEMRSKAADAIRSKAAALRAQQAVELALADAKRALDEERHKRGAYERDLAAARQSVAALGARANLAVAEQAAAVDARKLAEATASRAGEVLSSESEQGRSLARDLDAALRERAEARRALEEGRHKLAAHERDLAAARQSVANLEARANLAVAEQAAAVEARKLAEATASRAGEALALESEKGRSLARDLDAALRERAEARQALDEERQKLATHERDLAAVRQSVTELEARANLAATEQAAAVEARKLAEAAASRAGEALALESEKGRSLARDLDAALRERADAKRALDEERHKLAAHERDLAAARQSLAELETRANLAATEQAAAAKARKLAEAAAAQAHDALASELGKGRSLARDLDAARRERDAAKKELNRVLAAQRTALKQRERVKGRDLAEERESLKSRTERRVAVDEPVPKARVGNRTSERAKAVQSTAARSAREPGSRKVRRVQVRNPTQAVRPATIVLPDELLPERLPVNGLW